MGIPVGLQLYSLRAACAEDFYEAIRAVAAAGYDGVEFAGFFDKPAGEVRRVVEDAGLAVFGAHIGYEQLLPENIAATIDYHAELGNRDLIVPGLPADHRDSAEACRKTGDFFCQVAATLREQGMATGYHSHAGDMRPLPEPGGGAALPAYDRIAQATPEDFILQIDVGNVVQGGACPLAYLYRYPGRYGQVHLKERLAAGAGKWNLPIGSGSVPWAGVVEASRLVGGTRRFIVEVEEYWDDPIECARQDRAILRYLGV